MTDNLQDKHNQCSSDLKVRLNIEQQQINGNKTVKLTKYSADHQRHQIQVSWQYIMSTFLELDNGLHGQLLAAQKSSR